MSRAAIDALVIPTSDGSEMLAAPMAGKVRLQRLVGEVLRPGSRIGLIVQGERTFDLLLPAGKHGQLDALHVHDPWSACQYGQ